MPDNTINIENEEQGPNWYKGKQYSGIRAFRGSKDILSNLHIIDNKIEYDSTEYTSVEHGYKSKKAEYYDRGDVIELISNTEDPTDAMNIANAELYGEDEREEWVRERSRIMKDLIHLKAKQSPKFKEELINSKNKILVEATKHIVWASGLPSVNATKTTAPNKWPGQNLLGNIMMEVRSEILGTLEMNGDSENKEMQGIEQQQFPEAKATNETQNNSNESSQNLEPARAIILGDSILSNASCSEGFSIHSKSGTTINDIESLIHKVEDEVNPLEVNNVVIALGVNDLKDHGSVGTTTAKYTKAMQKAKKAFPNSTLFLSAILPRRNQTGHFTTFNSKVKDVNKFIKEYAEDDETVYFVSNCNTFTGNDKNNLYSDSDSSGVHLSKAGKDKLVNIIENAVNSQISLKKKKRTSSVLSTPGSAKKEAKSGRWDANESVKSDSEHT